MLSFLMDVNGLNKQQKRWISSLTKKFSEKNSGDLEKACNLLYSLYYSGHMEAVKECMRIVCQIKFDGNFNTWTFIQPAYTLKFYMSQDSTEQGAIRQMLCHDVRSKLHDDEQHQITLDKIRLGHSVQTALKSLERNGKEPKDEYTFRQIVLFAYLHVLAIGTCKELNEPEVRKQIDANLKRLVELQQQIQP